MAMGAYLREKLWRMVMPHQSASFTRLSFACTPETVLLWGGSIAPLGACTAGRGRTDGGVCVLRCEEGEKSRCTVREASARFLALPTRIGLSRR
jgi:hypothetical protein